jgi:hypothetical protein
MGVKVQREAIRLGGPAFYRIVASAAGTETGSGKICP